MAEAMVTARMDQQKKQRVGTILEREGLNASQAINTLYDRIAAEGTADFLVRRDAGKLNRDRQEAAQFIDALSVPLETRFDSMSPAEVRADRLKSRGLL